MMKCKGYLTQDVTKQFTSITGIKQAHLTGNSNFKIEFYELASDDRAIKSY